MPNIRSHYVPIFYLKNFGNLVYTFDKTNESTFQTRPKNIGCEKNFYGRAESGNKHELESAMRNVESKAYYAIKEMIKTGNFSNLSDKNKDAFYAFTALQYLRTPEARIRDVKIKDEFHNQDTRESRITDGKTNATDEAKIASHIDMIKEHLLISNVLKKMSIAIFKNDTSIPLWTSDNPVVLCNKYEEIPCRNLGVTSEGTEVHLPLGPKLMVLFYDPRNGTRLPDVSLMESDHVIQENRLQAIHSTRFVYSNTGEFYMMKDYLNSEYEVRNP